VEYDAKSKCWGRSVQGWEFRLEIADAFGDIFSEQETYG
jgi:hypothetical protein